MTKLHFSLITDLKCFGNHDPNYSIYGNAIRDTYFTDDSRDKGEKMVKREIIRLIYKKCQAKSDLDAVKLSLVYLFFRALLSNVSNIMVPDYVLRLANDFDAFNAYSWGTMV